MINEIFSKIIKYMHINNVKYSQDISQIAQNKIFAIGIKQRINKNNLLNYLKEYYNLVQLDLDLYLINDLYYLHLHEYIIYLFDANKRFLLLCKVDFSKYIFDKNNEYYIDDKVYIIESYADILFIVNYFEYAKNINVIYKLDDDYYLVERDNIIYYALKIINDIFTIKEKINKYYKYSSYYIIDFYNQKIIIKK
ncbi:MAG: hypothetical protein KatS3mg068_2667 [Candidatus Sericytochromatia bacterium]|nr:MAG: hypothetical protein KatS3mg068_2667 [Candidatus Sericytochromatia bacterium]